MERVRNEQSRTNQSDPSPVKATAERSGSNPSRTAETTERDGDVARLTPGSADADEMQLAVEYGEDYERVMRAIMDRKK